MQTMQQVAPPMADAEVRRPRTFDELRSTVPEIRAQEDRQGWINLPCGDHGIPWRAEVVAMLTADEIPKMTPCEHVAGRTLPSVTKLVSFSQRLGHLAGATPDHDDALPEQVRQILQAKRARPEET